MDDRGQDPSYRLDRRRWRAGVLAALLAFAIPCLSAESLQTVSPATGAGAEAEAELTVLEEVVVYGTDGRAIQGLYAESEFNEAEMAAYGANSVGDLLAQVAPDVDNTEEGPVILINGRPANGITSVNELPSESVQSIQVLPPQAAAALGYSPTRRVINVILKQSFRQGGGMATVRGATAGRGFRSEANVSSVRVNGDRFRSLSFRASKTQPLLEAHRDIISQPAGLPYDLAGNVVSWPVAGGDIDPALSAMTGFPVTVLGVPEVSAPTLDDFLPMANAAHPGDVGRYRTLVADQFNFGLNGNLSFQLPRSTQLSVGFNGDHSHLVSRTGASSALLHLPASSPYSPFSQDVGIARYLGAPLVQQSDPTSLNLWTQATRQVGRWRVNGNINFSWRRSKSVTDRRIDTTQLQSAIDAGTLNPFDALPAELLDELLVDHARSRGTNVNLQLQASGTVMKLPAGNATLSLRGEMRQARQRSRTVGTNNNYNRRNRQDELAFASLQVPLLGKPTPQSFGMGAELSASARDVSAVGTLFDYGYGLNWRLGNRFTLRASVNQEKVAPQPEALTNPVIVVDDVRTYDFIRQETVLVRYITGGNPDLETERRRGTRIGLTMRPFARADFMINADYQRTRGRNMVSQLPAVSEDVQAAFPDRYRRDAEGRLVEVDARLVSFERSETESIRWGGNFRRTFGAKGAMPGPGPNAQQGMMIVDGQMIDEYNGPGWRFTANLTHTWQLTNTRLARRGLPEQDLLDGGAGLGSGQFRHNLQSRFGLSYKGTGSQLTVNWKSRSHITAGTASDPNDIVFSPFLKLDLSAFSDLGTVFPARPLLKGTRVTLAVDNLLAGKQRVRDENGVTPLRYQPYLLDSLGRTVSLSLRKTY